MSFAAFSFGSFGDVATVLQLAFQLRAALNDAGGASAEICALVTDFDQFTTAVQQAKAVLDRPRSGLQPDIRTAITAALIRCQEVLILVQNRIKAFETRMTRRLGSAVWREYWAALAWEILGGKREVNALRTRLTEQVMLIQTYLSIANCHDQNAIQDRASTQQVALERLRSAIEEIPRYFGPDMPSFMFEDAETNQLYHPIIRTSFEVGASLGNMFALGGYLSPREGHYPWSFATDPFTSPLRCTLKLVGQLGGLERHSYVSSLWFKDHIGEVNVLVGIPPPWITEYIPLTLLLLKAYVHRDPSVLVPCNCSGSACSHTGRLSRRQSRDATIIRRVFRAYKDFVWSVWLAIGGRSSGVRPLMCLLLSVLPNPDFVQHCDLVPRFHNEDVRSADFARRARARAGPLMDQLLPAVENAPRISDHCISHETLRDNIKILDTYYSELVLAPWIMFITMIEEDMARWHDRKN